MTRRRAPVRKKDVAAALRYYAAEHGHAPSMRDWDRQSGRPLSAGRIVKLFGTWNSAIRAARLKPRPPGWPHPEHWTREELIGFLHEPPTIDEWDAKARAKGWPTSAAMRKRFGTWRAALKAAGYTVPTPVAPHGTVTRYRHHDCRCSLCRRASANERADLRRRVREAA